MRAPEGHIVSRVSHVIEKEKEQHKVRYINMNTNSICMIVSKSASLMLRYDMKHHRW